MVVLLFSALLDNNNNRLFPICLQYFCFLYYISFIYSCIGKRLIPEPYGYIQVESGGLIDKVMSRNQ